MKDNPDNSQLLFDFDAPPMEEKNTLPAVAAEPVKSENFEAESVEPEIFVAEDTAPEPLTDFQLRQAVLAHLVKSGATGAALNVPSRVRKFQADLAAYYSVPHRRLNRISCCVMVDIYSRREQCIPDCSNQSEILQEMSELKAQRSSLEEQIRLEEPHLRATDELFDEFQSFNYHQSSNRTYHRVCRKIAKLQQALFKGTRMEQLSRAKVSDYLYLAVPEGLIKPEEMLDSWGLWYIKNDGSVVEVCAASRCECDDACRQHLVQNIGQAALNNVLFANGVKVKTNGGVRFTRPPRARRK